jgi:ribosomal protein S27E
MSGIHEANEDLQTMQRHVECADCHNGHQLNGDSGAPPLVMGATRGVTGIDLSGFDVTPAPYQYQVCLKCHADNNALFQTAVPRQIDEVNLRYRFDSINPSFHPVAAAGKNASVPGLLGMSESSYIYCTDCHGNADSVMAGGSEANGPHGSKYDHQLLYRYEQDSYPQTYSTLFYALCYSCHSETVLFDEAQTNFPSHQRHVRGRGTPCSICHDPHGVSSMGGATVTGNAHLINFDARFVDPASAVYNSVTKSCTVSCHSKNPRSY